MRLKFTYRQNKLQFLAWLITTPLLFVLIKWMMPSLPSSPMEYDGFWANKICEKAENDVVYIGDSRVYRGINPQIIDSILNIKSFNFGFSSAGLDTFLLNRAVLKLNPSGKKTIVLGLSINELLSPSLVNGHYHSIAKLKSSDLYIMSYFYEHLKFADPYVLSDFFKVYKGEKYFETFYPESGFVASNKEPMDSTVALMAYSKQFKKAKFDETNFRLLLSRIVELQKDGYHFYALRMPCTYAMLSLEDRSFNNKMTQVLDLLKAWGVELLEPNLKLNSYDGSHLDASSAKCLSVFISESIKK